MRRFVIFIVVLIQACISKDFKNNYETVVYAKTSNISKEYKNPKSTINFSFNHEVALESNIISLTTKYDSLYLFGDLDRWILKKQDSTIIGETTYSNYLFIDLSSEKIIQAVSSGNDIIILRLGQYDILYQINNENGISTIPLIDYIVDSTELFIEKPPAMKDINEIDEKEILWTK